MRAAAVLAAVSLAFGQSRTLPPKDESGRDAKFAAFFARFREIVRKKDHAALLHVVDPNIKNSFGGDDGIANFNRIWEMDRDDSPVFGTLARLLGLGGSNFSPETYCAPYVAVRFPDDLDAFEHLVVSGTGVRLRAEASVTSPVLDRFSFDIVRMVEHGPEWTQVRTLSGVNGFVATRYLYSPVGFRACFVRRETGDWLLSMLVAGD